jgi:hypothetical protein
LDDVEEALKIKQRKRNIIIHGMPETDAEHHIKSVAEMFGISR